MDLRERWRLSVFNGSRPTVRGLENAEAIIIIVAQTFDRFCISAESKMGTYIYTLDLNS